MRTRTRGFPARAAVLAAALALGSCETTIESSYQVDFRNIAVPVMLNAPKAGTAGRTVPITFNFSSSSTTSSYSTYNSTVTVTTTQTSQSTVPIAYQLLMNLGANDAGVYLRGIALNYHILMAPYYGENSRQISAEAVIMPKGGLR